jgi:carbamoyl-phosphate synthase small subunit
MGKTMQAVLALADGRHFLGRGLGVSGLRVGELVFNTAMSGYQEILSDPSYTAQLVTFTAPHIGNVGVNMADLEAATMQAAGAIFAAWPKQHSNWRAEQSLSDWLQSQHALAISGVDTRAITKILRAEGAQKAAILTHEHAWQAVAEAQAAAAAFSGLAGLDLAKVVSATAPYQWSEGVWGQAPHAEPTWQVVVYDFGVKRNILRLLVHFGCQVTVVPAQTPAETVLAMQPDGVLLSNGPGDPAPCRYAIAATERFLAEKLPVFGICLGHQLLALALGGETYKMKFGHHGANHPVVDVETGKVFITSQNHGFAVHEQLPATVKVTHRSLFDHSIQGIESLVAPAFSFQGHPEASPGPQEMQILFKKFIKMLQKRKENAKTH